MKDATDEYGKKMSLALAAVRRMHGDVSKLLVDADAAVGKGKVIAYGSYATQDLTYSYKADFWMAEGVYRFYATKPPADQTVVEALTVRFFDLEDRIAEPFLLVGQLKYQLAAGQTAVEYLNDKATRPEKPWWHLWYAYAGWSDGRKPGEVLVGTRRERNVAWFKVAGVPLYTITLMDDVVKLMDRVRAAEVPPAAANSVADGGSDQGSESVSA